MLLRFLWREWTALGVAGQERVALRHVIDPEALLLFTCSLGRYDQRLFDEVLDWLARNGRFLNVQRMRNMLRQEGFHGGDVVSAVADWMSQRDSSVKWRTLAGAKMQADKPRALFSLPDGCPLPQPADNDPTFLKHGLVRGAVTLRGYSQVFPADSAPCRLLGMRALFGVNARCDILTYLAIHGASHPREIARELYYSQKAVHDAMTDMACSSVVHSSRGTRERTFRIASNALPFLTGPRETARWVNWPILLTAAETVWEMTETLLARNLDPLVEASQIVLTLQSVLDRLTRARWAPAIPTPQTYRGIEQLQAFQTVFETTAA